MLQDSGCGGLGGVTLEGGTTPLPLLFKQGLRCPIPAKDLNLLQVRLTISRSLATALSLSDELIVRF